MIDLHTHVLPRVDDGPASIEDSLKIISALASGGTEIVVATPHNMPGMFESSIKQITFAAESLRNALAGAKSPVKLLLGQEITFRPGLLDQIEAGELLTINDTPCFLVEFPPYFVPPGAREFIFQARLKGYTPVLAHPERNERLQKDLGFLEELVRGGSLTQLTAGSIMGRLGPQAEKASHMMLKNGLAHVIATDCHSFRFGPGDLSEAVQIAGDIIGKEAALNLVEANPRAIVEGRPPEP